MSTAERSEPAPATLVLAAGASTRFGSPKQLQVVGREAMLARVLATLDGITNGPQLVVLGAHAGLVSSVVPAESWRIITAEDWEAGLGASLRAGLAAIPDDRPVLIVLGDLAWLAREAAERVLEAARAPENRSATVLRAFDGDVPGHPVLLRGEAVRAARGAPDAGPGKLLKGLGVVPVPCDGLGTTLDVDTVADLNR